MSIPTKHHYLPEFLQRRWTTPENPEVWRYTRPHQRLDAKKVHPSQAGFERNLYAMPSHPDPAKRQVVEQRIMAPLDTAAAEALTYIEVYGQRPPDPRLHNGWIRFVLSLLYRTPRAVEHVRKLVRENDEATWNELEARYLELRGADDPPTYGEYRDAAGPLLTEQTEAKLLVSMIGNENVGAQLASMHWRFVQFGDAKHSLLLSDDPVMMSNGIARRTGFIMMPVAKDAFFIAANDLRVADAFVDQSDRLPRAINDAVVRQADHLVIAADDSHRRFIDNRFKIGSRRAEDGWSERMQRLTWNSPIDLP